MGKFEKRPKRELLNFWKVRQNPFAEALFRELFAGISLRKKAELEAEDRLMPREGKTRVELLAVVEPVTRAFFLSRRSGERMDPRSLARFVDAVLSLSLAFIEPNTKKGFASKHPQAARGFPVQVQGIFNAVGKAARGLSFSRGRILQQVQVIEKGLADYSAFFRRGVAKVKEELLSLELSLSSLHDATAQVYVSYTRLGWGKQVTHDRLRIGLAELQSLLGRKEAVALGYALQEALKEAGYELADNAHTWLDRARGVPRKKFVLKKRGELR